MTDEQIVDVIRQHQPCKLPTIAAHLGLVRLLNEGEYTDDTKRLRNTLQRLRRQGRVRCDVVWWSVVEA